MGLKIWSRTKKPVNGLTGYVGFAEKGTTITVEEDSFVQVAPFPRDNADAETFVERGLISQTGKGIKLLNLTALGYGKAKFAVETGRIHGHRTTVRFSCDVTQMLPEGSALRDRAMANAPGSTWKRPGDEEPKEVGSWTDDDSNGATEEFTDVPSVEVTD